MGTHHARPATLGKKSASTALAGTHNFANTDSLAGIGPFPKPRALVLPLVHFGQSKKNMEGQLNGIHAWRATILPTLIPQFVENSMRLFFEKLVIMFRTSPINGEHWQQRPRYLAPKDTFELDPVVSHILG